MPLDRDDQKEVIKEAIREWLDEKYAEFGKWSMRGIVALLLGALLYMFFATHGWTPK